ncbi:hypothetical protein G9A89_012414 [Geosiphon pyriformis]|nr:hypothetical protein G9A89_012414 [Geosiphon pyriformis]
MPKEELTELQFWEAIDKTTIEFLYPITYTNKGKGKLQTPAVTPQRIQPPTWKKTRVKSPNNSSYHYTSESVINISSTDASTSNATSTFEHFPFQTKQRKEDLLGLYGETTSLWKITESEGKQEVEEEKESEDHEFTYQNLILENPESETPNFQTQPNLDNQENDTPNIQTPPNQNNSNSEIINQYLFPVIVIDQPSIEPIGQFIQSQNQQQPPPVPLQQ